MAIIWTDWNNGGSLLTLRQNLNTFNNSVVTDVNSNTVATTSNTSNIATNTLNIATNTDDIAALQTVDIDNESRITHLEDVHDAFAYNSANGSSTTSNTWTPLNTVEIVSAAAGLYQMLATVVFTYSTTTRSAYFRVSLDGGTTWLEFRKEIKDITDTHLQTQMCIIEHTTGDVNVQIEFRTENNGDVLTVLKNCLTLDRKN